MAKEIWVYTLDNKSISPKLKDFNGKAVASSQKHHIYVTDEGHPQVASDGSKPLYHSADGKIDPIRLSNVVKAKEELPPNNTEFVSAHVITNADGSANGAGVIVVLSDDKGYASVHTEWSVKINGTEKPAVGVDGHNTNTFTIDLGLPITIKAGDVVTVSHLVAGSGIKKFIDKPVTNSLA